VRLADVLSAERLSELVAPFAASPTAISIETIDGQVVAVWDHILEAYILWECRCPTQGGCRWFRLGFQVFRPGWADTEFRRLTWDRHRRCPSIVCLWHRHTHYWPLLVNSDSPWGRKK